MGWGPVLLGLAQILAQLAAISLEHSKHWEQREQVRREAEAQCDFFLQLFKSLAESIRDKLGHDALGPELASCLDAFDPTRIRDLAEKVESLVAKGEEPAVVNEIQVLTRLSWDDVFSLISRWPAWTTEQKAKWSTMQLIQQSLAATGRARIPGQ